MPLQSVCSSTRGKNRDRRLEARSRSPFLYRGRPAFWCAIVAASLATSSSCAQSPLTGKPPSFERDVLPILSAHCLRCHGTDTRKAGLDLRTPSAMLRGGADGPAIV